MLKDLLNQKSLEGKKMLEEGESVILEDGTLIWGELASLFEKATPKELVNGYTIQVHSHIGGFYYLLPGDHDGKFRKFKFDGNGSDSMKYVTKLAEAEGIKVEYNKYPEGADVWKFIYES